jgi:hypothetical protein
MRGPPSLLGVLEANSLGMGDLLPYSGPCRTPEASRDQHFRQSREAISEGSAKKVSAPPLHSRGLDRREDGKAGLILRADG